jgi:hypothetical protein
VQPKHTVEFAHVAHPDVHALHVLLERKWPTLHTEHIVGLEQVAHPAEQDLQLLFERK